MSVVRKRHSMESMTSSVLSRLTRLLIIFATSTQYVPKGTAYTHTAFEAIDLKFVQPRTPIPFLTTSHIPHDRNGSGTARLYLEPIALLREFIRKLYGHS